MESPKSTLTAIAWLTPSIVTALVISSASSLSMHLLGKIHISASALHWPDLTILIQQMGPQVRDAIKVRSSLRLG